MLYLILLLGLLSPPTGPVEWLQEATIDLGDTFQDEEVTYAFRFRNVTDAPLVVDNVRVGCGCTATEWQDLPIAPGEEGTINVTYDAANPGFLPEVRQGVFPRSQGRAQTVAGRIRRVAGVNAARKAYLRRINSYRL